MVLGVEPQATFRNSLTYGLGDITFSELTPLKSPICILDCHGNVRLHQTTTKVRTRSPRRLRKLERKGRRAYEPPRTYDGTRERGLPPLQMIFKGRTFNSS